VRFAHDEPPRWRASKIGRLRWPGKGRWGNRLVVKRKRGGAVLLDHNGAETYRCNDEVEARLAKYLAERK
jgi:hypothetical protein